MLDHVSNKSSISSPCSSVDQDLDDTPTLIAVEEQLPTFAKAAAIHLPCVVVPDQEPPSFRLSAALQETTKNSPQYHPELPKFSYAHTLTLTKPSTPSPTALLPPYTAEPSPPAKSLMPVVPRSNNSATSSSPAASKSLASKGSWELSTSPL